MRAALAIAAFAFLCAGPASAAKVGSCIVTVLNEGVLKPNAQLKSLSSRNPGGNGVMVRVQSNFSGSVVGSICGLGVPLNCGRVRLTPPTSVGLPPGEPNPDSVGKLTVESGSQTILVQENASSMVLLNGDYTFRIDLDASKATGIFRAGTYRTTQTVVCD